jgi:hypothetical protein
MSRPVLNDEVRASNLKITGEAEAAAMEARAKRPAPIPTSSRW